MKKTTRTLLIFLMSTALLAGCNLADADEHFDFKPGNSLSIGGDAVVNTPDTISYYVKAFTIDKSYSWTVNGNEVDSYRKGEYIDIIYPDDQPGDYTIQVTDGTLSGELVVDARGDVVQEASMTGYSEMVAAIEQAGLTATLKSAEKVTLLTPTDSAFVAAYDANDNGSIEDSEYPLNLSDIIQYHVIQKKLPSSDIEDSMTVETMEGSDVQFFVDEEGNMQVNMADMGPVDIPATNGPIHAIDSVLSPPALP